MQRQEHQMVPPPLPTTYASSQPFSIPAPAPTTHKLKSLRSEKRNPLWDKRYEDSRKGQRHSLKLPVGHKPRFSEPYDEHISYLLTLLTALYPQPDKLPRTMLNQARRSCPSGSSWVVWLSTDLRERYRAVKALYAARNVTHGEFVELLLGVGDLVKSGQIHIGHGLNAPSGCSASQAQVKVEPVEGQSIALARGALPLATTVVQSVAVPPPALSLTSSFNTPFDMKGMDYADSSIPTTKTIKHFLYTTSPTTMDEPLPPYLDTPSASSSSHQQPSHHIHGAHNHQQTVPQQPPTPYSSLPDEPLPPYLDSPPPKPQPPT
ncbi:hypothetical protein HK097_003798, partial [Rhizophlyctis rosea]